MGGVGRTTRNWKCCKALPASTAQVLGLITGTHHLAQLQVLFCFIGFFLYSLPKYSLPTLCLLPIGPRAGNPLGSHLADKETITGASNILLSWRCILDGLGNNEKENNGYISKKAHYPNPLQEHH